MVKLYVIFFLFFSLSMYNSTSGMAIDRPVTESVGDSNLEEVIRDVERVQQNLSNEMNRINEQLHQLQLQTAERRAEKKMMSGDSSGLDGRSLKQTLPSKEHIVMKVEVDIPGREPTVKSFDLTSGKMSDPSLEEALGKAEEPKEAKKTENTQETAKKAPPKATKQQAPEPPVPAVSKNGEPDTGNSTESSIAAKIEDLNLHPSETHETLEPQTSSEVHQTPESDLTNAPSSNVEIFLPSNSLIEPETKRLEPPVSKEEEEKKSPLLPLSKAKEESPLKSAPTTKIVIAESEDGGPGLDVAISEVTTEPEGGGPKSGTTAAAIEPAKMEKKPIASPNIAPEKLEEEQQKELEYRQDSTTPKPTTSKPNKPPGSNSTMKYSPPPLFAVHSFKYFSFGLSPARLVPLYI